MKRLLSKPSAASCLEVRKDHYFEKNAARRATLPAPNAIKDNSKTFSAELHQRSFTKLCSKVLLTTFSMILSAKTRAVEVIY